MATITSVVPNTGTVGDTITINGTGFTGVTNVKLGGVPVSFVFVSSIKITFTVPSEGGGLYDLELDFPGGTVTDTNAFTVDATPPPFVGTNVISYLEVFVYGNDGTTPLDILEGAYSITFQRDLNTVGSGSFVIVRSDPKATPANLALGNLVRIRLNGVNVFAFWIEEPDEMLTSSAGPSGEEMTIAGRGSMAYMDRACVYPVSFPHPAATDIPYPATGTTGVAPAFILYDQLEKAHARGALSLMNWDFTGTHDTAGNPWPGLVFDTIHVGDDLLSLASHITTLSVPNQNIEYIFNHDTFTLSAYVAPFGVDRTKSVVWRQGKHFGNNPSRQSKHFSAAKSRMIVEGAAGIATANITEVVDSAYEAESNVGRREGYMSYPQSTDIATLGSIGLGALKNLEAQTNPFKVSLLHGTDAGNYEPFFDYDCGDFITVDIPGVHNMEKFRIVTITIGFVGVGQGDYSIDVDLTSPYIAPLLKIKQNVLNVLQFATFTNNGGGGGGGGGACCGGEILMAEAENLDGSVITGSGDGTVITIPITVDTTNTRIRTQVIVHVAGTADGQVQGFGLGPVTRLAPFSGDGKWHCVVIELPALFVIAEGSYDISVLIGGGGTWEVFYQVLVYLVTSG